MSLSIFLSSLGLDEKSQKVYLALLQLSDAPATMISKKAGLKRTTTHHHLEQLVGLGLASSYRQNNAKRFVAENPSKIKGLLETKIATFEKYLPDLQKISTVRERFTKLRLFEGEEGMRQIAEEELSCHEKIVRSVGSMKDLRKAADGKITFTSRRLEKKIFSRCLRPENDEFKKGWLENQQQDLREVRLLPKGSDFPGMTFVYDDKVAVITPDEEGVGFIVTSKTFNQQMKSAFDILWEKSSKTI